MSKIVLKMALLTSKFLSKKFLKLAWYACLVFLFQRIPEILRSIVCGVTMFIYCAVPITQSRVHAHYYVVSRNSKACALHWLLLSSSRLFVFYRVTSAHCTLFLGILQPVHCSSIYTDYFYIWFTSLCILQGHIHCTRAYMDIDLI